ncbi:epoxide hydrolase family protein [Peterkaempfera griseoplana]|uniref:epoxide hydrolase family protein n=1 Tax=Peterkaempfera griseoplana TaxID=66896 RepID=UPI0006E14D76|nr:epoxide hydrolase family protein [Peterkaempfera griseoplana]
MPLPLSPVPDSEVDDLRRRLAATRRPPLPQGVGWERGTDAGFLAGLLTSWRDRFDWRAQEARILDLPWETTGSGDRALRVVHQRATADAPVVVLLHGWPDSVLRFQRVLPLLEDLNVVVPALPGFPFAHELTQPGMTVAAMASLTAGAVQALGYDRYVVSGGDVGADVAEQLAVSHPDRVAALHLTNVSPLHAVFADRSALDAEELAYLDTVARWQRAEGGYIAQQSTKPHTLAPALADSPAGLAAWIVEKLQSWSDVPFEEEELLTWISAYWFTNTIGTSFAPYAEFAAPAPYVPAPTVLSAFAHDTKPAPRSFAARYVNVQEFVEHETGGHFAAWEQPHRYAEDLRRAVALGHRPHK